MIAMRLRASQSTNVASGTLASCCLIAASASGAGAVKSRGVTVYCCGLLFSVVVLLLET